VAFSLDSITPVETKCSDPDKTLRWCGDGFGDFGVYKKGRCVTSVSSDVYQTNQQGFDFR
jgi:hypothetical protein